MLKAYLPGCYREINNPEALAAHAKLGGSAVEANGGRILAHYHSDANQLALDALGDGAVRDMRLVEGIE